MSIKKLKLKATALSQDKLPPAFPSGRVALQQTPTGNYGESIFRSVVESPSNFSKDNFDKKILLRTKLRKTISGGTFLTMKSPAQKSEADRSQERRHQSLKMIKDRLKKGENERIEAQELNQVERIEMLEEEIRRLNRKLFKKKGKIARLKDFIEDLQSPGSKKEAATQTMDVLVTTEEQEFEETKKESKEWVVPVLKVQMSAPQRSQHSQQQSFIAPASASDDDLKNSAIRALLKSTDKFSQLQMPEPSPRRSPDQQSSVRLGSPNQLPSSIGEDCEASLRIPKGESGEPAQTQRTNEKSTLISQLYFPASIEQQKPVTSRPKEPAQPSSEILPSKHMQPFRKSAYLNSASKGGSQARASDLMKGSAAGYKAYLGGGMKPTALRGQGLIRNQYVSQSAKKVRSGPMNSDLAGCSRSLGSQSSQNSEQRRSLGPSGFTYPTRWANGATSLIKK